MSRQNFDQEHCKWMLVYGSAWENEERERERNSIIQYVIVLVVSLFTCYLINTDQLVSLFNVQTQVVAFLSYYWCYTDYRTSALDVNYYQDCLTMRKNATLPTCHRHRLFRVFLNHQPKREGEKQRDKYGKT